MIELRLRLRTASRRTRPLVAALQALARLARLERGCVEAQLFAESNDPRRLCYSEVWDAEENLRSMLRSERFTHLAELMETAAEPPVLDFRTITAVCGLEFAWQARHNHVESMFAFDSGNDSYPEPEVLSPPVQDKETGPLS